MVELRDDAGPVAGGDRSDAILFVIDREPEGLARAIEMLRKDREGVPAALAIAKADQFLAAEDPAWAAEPEWWRPHLPNGDGLHDLILLFGGRVWPVSSYGFHGEQPAVLWSEFGQFLPWNGRPRNVHRPFDDLLESLGYR